MSGSTCFYAIKLKGWVNKIRSNAEGYLPLPDMNLKMKVKGKNLIVTDIMPSEQLCDMRELSLVEKAN